MGNQADHTIVRLRVPPELKDKIEKAAEANNRSQSAEMVARLEESFSKNASNTNLAELIALQEETIEYMKQLHNQNAELSRELREEKNRNETRFKELNVLRGLDAVSKRPGVYIDNDGNETPSENHDPNKNYLNINKKKGK
nr:Arc family DNA-binding protein [Acinetobacter nosocomialis]